MNSTLGYTDKYIKIRYTAKMLNCKPKISSGHGDDETQTIPWLTHALRLTSLYRITIKIEDTFMIISLNILSQSMLPCYLVGKSMAWDREDKRVSM
jgi:hypothetical protein